jgi:hypothetical protein
MGGSVKGFCLSGFVLLSATAVAAAAATAAEKFNPCSLLTAREIEEVQGDKVVSAKASEPQRGNFAVSQCFFTLATFSKSISLEVTRPRPGEADTPRVLWSQMYAKAIEKGKKGEDVSESEEKAGRERKKEAEARPHRVSGVGDEAFWSGTPFGGGLFVLKGDAYFRLSVGGPEPEAVKIEKLKKLARRALPRLR